MESKKIEIPEWLSVKVRNNHRTFNDEQFTALAYYYKQITNTKLRKNCSNCIADAFIVINIYLKKQ